VANLRSPLEIMTRLEDSYGGQFAHLFLKELMGEITATPPLENDDFISLEVFYRRVSSAIKDAKETGYLEVIGTSQKGEIYDKLPIAEMKMFRDFVKTNGDACGSELNCMDQFFRSLMSDVRYWADRQRARKSNSSATSNSQSSSKPAAGPPSNQLLPTAQKKSNAANMGPKQTRAQPLAAQPSTPPAQSGGGGGGGKTKY